MLKFTWFIGFCNIIWSRGPLHERGKSLHVTHLEMLAALIIEPCIMTIYGVKINTWPSCLAGTQTFVEVPDQKSPSLVSTASPRAGPRLFLSPARVVLYLLVKWSPCLASICDLHIWCRVLVTNDTHCPHGASLNGVLATCDSGWGYAPALAGVDIKWLEAHVRASSSKSVSALQLGHKKTYDFLCVLRSGARMLGKRSGGGGGGRGASHLHRWGWADLTMRHGSYSLVKRPAHSFVFHCRFKHACLFGKTIFYEKFQWLVFQKGLIEYCSCDSNGNDGNYYDTCWHILWTAQFYGN